MSASTSHLAAAGELTRNQQLVLGVLEETEGPLSAYAILDELRGEGMRAPLQIYRALEQLQQKGLVHRLESANAFVVCRHPDCGGHDMAAFTICDACDAVGELSDANLSAVIRDLAEERGFAAKRTVIELRGLCADCKEH